MEKIKRKLIKALNKNNLQCFKFQLQKKASFH